jgi:hypothetical protein
MKRRVQPVCSSSFVISIVLLEDAIKITTNHSVRMHISGINSEWAVSELMDEVPVIQNSFGGGTPTLLVRPTWINCWALY